MKIRGYMKNKISRVSLSATKDKFVELFCSCSLPVRRKILFSTIFVAGIVFVGCVLSNIDLSSLKDDSSTITFEISPAAVTPSKTSVISIPNGMVKAHPFLPYKEINSKTNLNDVPQTILMEPPTTLGEDADAIRVMDTIVSGILYDKFSPSAILNIEGNDYLVKKGDVVNNYNVLAITQNSVTVKLGANVYKAGIGQILTEGNVNHNDVSNLNNKFGGDKQ